MGSGVSWPASPTRHCLQALSGFRCPEWPKLFPPLWRGCYSENNSLSVLKSPLLPAHLMSSIRDRLAYSGIRNITDKCKKCACLNLSRERFSEILLFFWCSLCPRDGWEARSETGQSWLRNFSRKELHWDSQLQLLKPRCLLWHLRWAPWPATPYPKKSTKRRSCILGSNCRQFECSQRHPAPAPFLWDLDLAPRWKDICVGSSMKRCCLLARQELAEIKACKSKKENIHRICIGSIPIR